MSTTTTIPKGESGAPEEPDGAERTRLVEALLDSLPTWTIVAAGISFLYLVWATLEVLARYVGGIPKLAP